MGLWDADALYFSGGVLLSVVYEGLLQEFIG